MAIPDPQERYATTLETQKLSNGKVVYKSAIPKAITAHNLTDATLTATDIVRMDKLAQNAYGSPVSWWKIAAANGRVDGSLYFRPGTRIIVPR